MIKRSEITGDNDWQVGRCSDICKKWRDVIIKQRITEKSCFELEDDLGTRSLRLDQSTAKQVAADIQRRNVKPQIQGDLVLILHRKMSCKSY